MEYPEHEKMAAVKDESQAVGEFLDWLPSKGWMLCSYSSTGISDRLYPIGETINKILSEYFDIDLVAIDQEKSVMLDKMREMNSLSFP